MATDKETPVETLDLQTPIQHGEETIKRLEFYQLRAKHMKDMPVADFKMGDFSKLLSRMCAQPPSVIGELTGKDFMKAVEVAATFLPGSPETIKNL